MRKTKKELIINIVLFIVVSLICFFILEFGVRLLLGPGRIQNYKGEVPYISDSELGFKLKPNYRGYFKEIDFNTEFNTNAQGFRGPDFNILDKNVIFIIGDSFAAGSGVEENETSSYYLQQELKDKYKIYNLGVPGYSQRQHVVQLENMLPVYNPKIILAYLYTGNDITDNCADLPDIEKGTSTYEKLKYTIKRSQLIVLIYRKLIVPFKYPQNLNFYINDPNVEECYEKTKEHIKKMQEAASKYNAILIIIIIPREAQTVKEKKEDLIEWYDNFESYDPVKFDLDIVNKEILKTCNELDIECFDLTSVFKEKDGESLLYLKDSHWNREGHKFASEEIAKYLNVNNYLN